jgi:HEAT repeat protein
MGGPGSSGADALVLKLTGSVLFSPDFPRRKRLTHAEWAVLNEEQRREATSASGAAIRLANNHRELSDDVTLLADAKHASAVPVLAELWATCALVPVRHAAGRALRQMATPAARQALIDLIEDPDYLSVFLAVRAMFDEDPASLFERCANYFTPERIAQPGGGVIPHQILRFFAPGGFLAGKTPQWTEPKAQGLLQQDKRWVDLCVRLRKDKRVGSAARYVLRHADAAAVKESLKKTLAAEGPSVIHTTTRASGDLLVRYQQGQHEAVWQELRAFQNVGGDLLEEAEAVASETMKRVVHNADLLAERLAAHGWKPLYSSLRTSPCAEDLEVIERIEEMTGAPLPISLRRFWEIVGGINFVWDYDSGGAAPNIGVDLPMDELDPICVDCPDVTKHVFDEWEHQRAGVDPELVDPFSLDLAPDYLHKADISGGAAYAIDLPFYGVDPIFANEEHNLPFVDYLRLCFRWGGFPRLERYADRSDVQSFLSTMTKNFEPF